MKHMYLNVKHIRSVGLAEEVSAIRIKELEIFLEVSRAKSIREVARRLQLTPGQVSKAIQQLESKLGTKLYKRSVTGVLPTAQGTELLKIAYGIVAGGEEIKQLLAGQGKTQLVKTVAIASTSFVNSHLTTHAVCKFKARAENVNFRFLDLAPDQLVPVAFRGGFEAAVHFGRISWPSTWVSVRVGKCRWRLCGRPQHPISRKPTLKQVLEFPFVIPTYWTQEGLVRGDDQFPMPISKRKVGFETATADAVIPILQRTDQLAFLPEILVNPFVRADSLRVIFCAELQAVERELFLSVRSDIVSDSMFRGLAEKLSQELVL